MKDQTWRRLFQMRALSRTLMKDHLTGSGAEYELLNEVRKNVDELLATSTEIGVQKRRILS